MQQAGCGALVRLCRVRGAGSRGDVLGPPTDELYRPSRECITPAFCLGFAIDSGGGTFENVFLILGGIPKKCHCSQAITAIQSEIPDAGNAIRYREARKAGAVIKGTASLKMARL